MEIFVTGSPPFYWDFLALAIFGFLDSSESIFSPVSFLVSVVADKVRWSFVCCVALFPPVALF
jgi:hypothetical protein